MPNLRGSEWLIIILLLVLLFGAKRLPDAARSMGRSLRIFKAETKGLVDDGNGPASEPGDPGQPASITGQAPLAPPAAAPAPPAPVAEPQSGAWTPQPPAQT